MEIHRLFFMIMQIFTWMGSGVFWLCFSPCWLELKSIGVNTGTLTDLLTFWSLLAIQGCRPGVRKGLKVSSSSPASRTMSVPGRSGEAVGCSALGWVQDAHPLSPLEMAWVIMEDIPALLGPVPICTNFIKWSEEKGWGISLVQKEAHPQDFSPKVERHSWDWGRHCKWCRKDSNICGNLEQVLGFLKRAKNSDNFQLLKVAWTNCCINKIWENSQHWQRKEVLFPTCDSRINSFLPIQIFL